MNNYKLSRKGVKVRPFNWDAKTKNKIFKSKLSGTEQEHKSTSINPQFEDLTKPDTIINHIKELQMDEKVQIDEKGLFIIKSGNEWLEEAKHKPTPKMLFGELWFENELCILFADTNLGKSILAVQIGDSISKGNHIEGFKLQANKQPVLYFDFELSSKQYEVRYALDVGSRTLTEHYNFDKDFQRVEINPDANIPENIDYEDYLIQEIEEGITQSGAKIIIIDNITFLKNETEKAKDALPLVKKLKELKNLYSLSLLVLAHTPKRDLSKPLSRNDLGGSRHLMNFADSSFAIGENPNKKGIRYIKHIKARNTEMKYDVNNVITCEIQKPHNFLNFKFIGYDSERNHLKRAEDTDWEQRKKEVLELKKNGISNTEIGKRYNVSESAVRKWIIKFNN